LLLAHIDVSPSIISSNIEESVPVGGDGDGFATIGAYTDMNALRIELHFPSDAPNLTFPGALQEQAGPTMRLIAKDTPALRARLTELLLVHPDVYLVVSPCCLGQTAECPDPRELVRRVLEDAAPEPLSYNVTEAAKRLGISYSYARKLVRLGRLKKANGRISSAEMHRYLAGARRT
jgi:hypothetical protein